jgi:glycosyltransferase involved in cell wall biosynthesis
VLERNGLGFERTQRGLEQLVSDHAPPPPPARDHAAALELSIIVPAYNEEDNVRPLYEDLMASVPQLGRPFEVIVVDDGSTDGTFARLAALAAADPRLRVIKFRRNYGQTPAMAAGIDHAGGRVLVTMDADLQNDPRDIGRLLEKLAEGYDLVVGWRQGRWPDKWLLRKLPSLLANWLIGWVTGVPVHDNGCTLKAFRAELIRRVPLYAEMHRFIPAMTSIEGARVAELPVNYRPRRFGQSKYGLSRIYKVCFDLLAIRTLLVFARRPWLSFSRLAAATALISLLCVAGALYDAFATAGRSTIVLIGVTFLLGSLTIFLGFVGLVGSLVYQHLIRAPAAAPHGDRGAG